MTEQQLVSLCREPTLTVLEGFDYTFVTRSLVRFSIFGIIILSISLYEIFGYMLDGLPQTHKAALFGSSPRFSKFKFSQIEYIWNSNNNNNHALKFRYVLNRIIKTFQMVHFFTGDQPWSSCWDLTKPLWLKILSNLKILSI